jgi:hypothetical protein
MISSSKQAIPTGEQRTVVTHRDLQLGDRIRLTDVSRAYNDATVINVTDKGVTVFRPYVHTSDFSTTAGIIPYLGFEQFDLWRDSDKTVTLLYREKPGAIR